MSVFLIGNIICAIGTLLMIRKIIKNRNILKGYDFIGSLLTFLAVTFFTYGFYQLYDILSVLFAFVTLCFWGLATVFTFANLVMKDETEREC